MGLRDRLRGLEKLGRQIAGQEKGERESQIRPDSAFGRSYNEQFERAPLSPRQRVAAEAATRKQLAWAAPVSAQDQRIAEAWKAAIEGLPGALRTEVTARFAALAEAEQQLADKRRRLADLPSDGDEIWIGRRAQLTSAVEQLEDLVKERTAACIQICRYSVPDQLERVSVTRLAEADTAIADAELEQKELLRRSRAEVGRLKMERNAIATVRAESAAPHLVEKHMGRMLSPDPRAVATAARKREEESRARLARALSNGRLH